MTTRDRRPLGRLGAAGVIAGAAVVLAAAPASAAGGTDLEAGLTGTTIAATSTGKVVDLTVTNAGERTAVGVTVTFDLGELERDKVEFVVPTGEDGEQVCDVTAGGDTVTCGVRDIPAGQRLDLGARLVRTAGTGPAGRLVVTVVHDGFDPDPEDNVVEVAVTVAGSGPDLYAYAPDVPYDPHTGQVGGAVGAGRDALLFYEVGNQGDAPVDGVLATIRLPRHVTFRDGARECRYNAARTVATCVFDRLALIPADQDDDAGDDRYSAVLIPQPIRVAAAAPAPGTLTDGLVTVEPIVATGSPEAPPARRAAATVLPAGATAARPGADVDATDNSDEFAVYVAAPRGGAGGGDDAGTLPITGTRPGLAAGVGAAALVGGVALVLLTRRRRVVPAAPPDKTPTA
jgi:hypothetical protein